MVADDRNRVSIGGIRMNKNLHSKFDETSGVYFSYGIFDNGYIQIKGIYDDTGWKLDMTGDSYFGFMDNKYTLYDVIKKYEILIMDFISKTKPISFYIPLPPGIEGTAPEIDGYVGRQDGNSIRYDIKEG